MAGRVGVGLQVEVKRRVSRLGLQVLVGIFPREKSASVDVEEGNWAPNLPRLPNGMTKVKSFRSVLPKGEKKISHTYFVKLIGATMVSVRPFALLEAALLLQAVFAICTASASHILVLNEDTFTDKIKEKDTLWFVKFCVPWCKHCARADSVWEELARALDVEDSVEIGQVDCTSSKPTCSNIGIQSYPTLKLFYDGEEYKTYTGKRELLDLKKFASEAALELSKESGEEA